MKTGEALEKKLAGSEHAQEAAQFFHASFGCPRPSFFHASFCKGGLDSRGDPFLIPGVGPVVCAWSGCPSPPGLGKEA